MVQLESWLPFCPERRHSHDPVCLEQNCAWSCALFGRRVAGTKQNHVRYNVDNHETVMESCFVYWYGWSHGAQGDCLKSNCPLFEERKGMEGIVLCLLYQLMCVYLPTRCIWSIRLSQWGEQSHWQPSLSLLCSPALIKKSVFIGLLRG